MDTRTLGEAMRDARERSGWSRESVAARGGFTVETLRAWEEDLRLPSDNYLRLFCRVVGCSLESLGIDEPTRD